MSIRALIFDFDGLILDTESTEYQSWEELFTAHGCQLSLDLWVDCIGRPRDYFDFYTHLEEVRGTAMTANRPGRNYTRELGNSISFSRFSPE
jgi:beta-phosphoglucomutase-like phosphatase (HAD superfamily)